MRRFHWISLVAVGLLALGSAAAWPLTQEPSTPLRTWKDDSGQFSIEAKFAKSEAGQVYLLKADGSQVVVPLARLSAADRQWIAERESPNGQGSQRPRELIQVDPKSANAWRLPVDELPRSNAVLHDHYFSFDIDGESFRTAELGCSQDGRFALVKYNSLGKGGVLVDLATGDETFLTGDDLGATTPRISPGGRLLLTSSANRVEVLAVQAGKPRRVQSLTTDQRTEGRNAAVQLIFADFAGDDLAITASSDGVLVAWDLGSGDPIWWMATSMHCVPGITPGGKFVIVHADGALCAVETASGRLVARNSVDLERLDQIAVSPDGSRIGGLVDGLCRIWDAQTGSELSEFASWGYSGTRFLWIDQKYLVFSDVHGQGSLVHLDIQAPVMTFTALSANSLAVIPQQGIMALTNEPQLMIKLCPIPHPALAQRVAVLARRDRQRLGQGKSVALDVHPLSEQTEGWPGNAPAAGTVDRPAGKISSDRVDELERPLRSAIERSLNQGGTRVVSGANVTLSVAYAPIPLERLPRGSPEMVLVLLRLMERDRPIWVSFRQIPRDQFIPPADSPSPQKPSELVVRLPRSISTGCSINLQRFLGSYYKLNRELRK